MKLGRRGFLQAVPAAIASAPVAAKVAAEKMGIGAGLANNIDNGLYFNEPRIDSSCEPQSHIDWCRDRLKEVLSDESVKHRRLRAKQESRFLDSDLASMHSMSPAVAQEIQIQRNYDRILEEEKTQWEREIAQATKQSMGLA